MTQISPQLLQAYVETQYTVFNHRPFTLSIDAFSPDLSALYDRYGVRCAAFISASNPYSQLLDDDANRARQLEFRQTLSDQGFCCIDGVGQHPGPHDGWPGEHSFLVPGLTLPDARHLAQVYQQNAFLWAGPDAVVRLVLAR
ncbi:MAG: DUF3293 domain-containing protein [Pusillimonas sp.]